MENEKYLRNEKSPVWAFNSLDSALNFSGTQASGANFQSGWSTVHNSTNVLQVWFPSSLSPNMRVADLKSSDYSFVAYCAYFSHGLKPPLSPK